jgi:ribosomal protein L13E
MDIPDEREGVFMQPEIVHKGRARKARGYSLEELKNANMNIRVAKRMKVPVDRRRKTAYEENITQLTTMMEKEKTKKKKGTKGKKKSTKPKK